MTNVETVRCTMLSTAVNASGWAANKKRSGNGVRSILGSTAYKIAHRADCDVLTVNPVAS